MKKILNWILPVIAVAGVAALVHHSLEDASGNALLAGAVAIVAVAFAVAIHLKRKKKIPSVIGFVAFCAAASIGYALIPGPEGGERLPGAVGVFAFILALETIRVSRKTPTE